MKENHPIQWDARKFLLFALSCLVAVALTPAAWAQTAPAGFVDDDTIFEVSDANVADPNPPTGDDWATLNPPTNANGLSIAKGFIADGVGNTIFWKGGSKDGNDIPEWWHKGGSVPNKDEIMNAYAAAYRDSDGDLIIYLGADRLTTEGDANIGFWLFQDDVSPIGDQGQFNGAHQTGDLFVVSAFTNGGTQPNISVYEWIEGTGLVNLIPDTQATCDGTDSHEACAVVNPGTLNLPWRGDVPAGAFIEAGINVSELLGGGGILPCFSSFLAETRSSAEPNAQLKDFARGRFDLCSVEISKVCNQGVVTGGDSVAYTYDVTVENTGTGTLYDLELTDTFVTDCTTNPPTTATRTFHEAELAPGAMINLADFDDYAAGDETFTNNCNGGFSNQARVTAEIVDGGTDDTLDESTSDACEAPVLNPVMSITKTCEVSVVPAAGSGELVVQVDFNGQICNEGNLTIEQISASDTVAGDLTLSFSSLGPATIDNSDPMNPVLVPTCQNYSGSYFPTASEAMCTEAGTIEFMDTVTASGETSLGGQAVQANNGLGATATCPLCPNAGSCDPPESN